MRILLAANKFLIFLFFTVLVCTQSFANSNFVEPYFTLEEFEHDFGGKDKCLATLNDDEGLSWAYIISSAIYIKLNNNLETFTPLYDTNSGYIGDLRMTFEKNNLYSDFKDPLYDGEIITRSKGFFSSKKEVEITVNQRVKANDKTAINTWTKKLIFTDKCSKPVNTQLIMGFFDRLLFGAFSR